jgi:hypothetical protein
MLAMNHCKNLPQSIHGCVCSVSSSKVLLEENMLAFSFICYQLKIWVQYFLHLHFLSTPCFATRCLYCNQRALVDNSGVIRAQMGAHGISESGCSAWDTLYNTTP